MSSNKYRTKGVCSSHITFDVEDGLVKNVQFVGGCNGNLQAIGRLVEGMPTEWVTEKIKGIKCGFKGTSCADQLAVALEQATK